MERARFLGYVRYPEEVLLGTEGRTIRRATSALACGPSSRSCAHFSIRSALAAGR
jgi:hypothetical protein